jgi:hypothetical protein
MAIDSCEMRYGDKDAPIIFIGHASDPAHSLMAGDDHNEFNAVRKTENGVFGNLPSMGFWLFNAC